MIYTSVDWVVRAGAEAEFVADVDAFRRWLLEQRGAESLVLLQATGDPRHFTSFGVFADTGLTAPWPAFVERLARLRARCESTRGRTYTVATADLERAHLNHDALEPLEVS
jgi:hypothetical protein